MTGTSVRYSGDHANVGLNLGGLRWVTTHRGMDHTDYADIRYEHGLAQMTAADLGVLVRRGQEALAALQPQNGQAPNCSGALADLERDA